jgi:hypothetical protein
MQCPRCRHAKGLPADGRSFREFTDFGKTPGQPTTSRDRLLLSGFGHLGAVRARAPCPARLASSSTSPSR